MFKWTQSILTQLGQADLCWQVEVLTCDSTCIMCSGYHLLTPLLPPKAIWPTAVLSNCPNSTTQGRTEFRSAGVHLNSWAMGSSRLRQDSMSLLRAEHGLKGETFWMVAITPPAFLLGWRNRKVTDLGQTVWATFYGHLDPPKARNN